MAHALRLEIGESFAQFVGGRVLKAAGQADVARAGANHVGVANRRQRHGVANDVEIKRSLRAGALDLELDGFATLAAHVFRDLLARPIARVTSVYFDNAVAVAQASTRRRSVLHGRLHVNAIAVLQDGDADAEEARVLVFLELAKFILREVH